MDVIEDFLEKKDIQEYFVQHLGQMSFKYLYLSLWSLQQLGIGDDNFWKNVYGQYIKPSFDKNLNVFLLYK